MSRCRSAIIMCGVLAGCSKPASPPTVDTRWSVPISVDGVELFVPLNWAKSRPWSPRPWPNGVRVDSGGWGSSMPPLGPIELAERLENGRAYVFDSDGRSKRQGRPDVFFTLGVTFEFPLPPPPPWWRPKRLPLASGFSIDRLTFSYRALADVVGQPYRKLLADVAPTTGKELGSGWREVRRSFEGRVIMLRFDARNWQATGGTLPRHIAASYSPARWSHYMRLDKTRWTAEFDTQKLPVDQWRSRYETTDKLFAWLQTRPGKRNADERFVWWIDLRYRTTK